MSSTKYSHRHSEKKSIRQEMRAKRLVLTPKQQNCAAHHLVRQARKHISILSSKRVLAYQAHAGEISPYALINKIKPLNLYLPKITHYRQGLMRFYPSHTLNTRNRYGILEPNAIGEPTNANHFDLILVPLVAFDRNGNRLGMGAGYYDRALAHLAHQPSTRPKLLGLAYHFQETHSVKSEPLDIPLDAIITDREFININV